MAAQLVQEQEDLQHEDDTFSSQEEDVADDSDSQTEIDADADVGIGPYLLARSVTEGKWTQLDEYVKNVVTKLRRREIAGSSAAAAQTAELLRTVVSRGNFHSVQELMDMVRTVGKSLSKGNRLELAIGNITRRVLYIIRQECAHALRMEETGVSDATVNVDLTAALHKLFDDEKMAHVTSAITLAKVKFAIIEDISELIDEIKTVYASISDQAVEHIHAKEIILTFGRSKTVVEFFEEAARLRKFEVIVAEGAPSYSGHEMAVQLAKLGIETTVITDSAVFAMMGVVNKIVVGTHAVMANGGLIAHTGAYNIAAAAKAHSVPLVVVAGLYKLCPLYAFDQDSFNEQSNPADVLGASHECVGKVDVQNPAFDYIPPEFVSLFITNFGGHNPSYVYRLLAEYYDPADYEL